MTSDPIERLLQAADCPIDPRPEFADELLETLLARLNDDSDKTEERETAMSSVIAVPPMTDASERRPLPWRRPHAARSAGRSSVLGYASTAALLLLTLIGGLYAADAPRQWGLIGYEATGVENELIASADVESIPDDFHTTFIGISRLTLEPGETLDSGPDSSYGVGVYLFEVESGSVAIAATGQSELTPAGSNGGTPMAEGGETILEAGGRGVLWPGTATIWRNDGTEPVVVLIAAVGEAVDFDSVDPLEQVLVKSQSMDWPELPATFTLRRLTFDSGASFPVAELPGLLVLGVESGEIYVPLANLDGSTRDRSFGPRDGYVATDWTVAPDGDLRNSGSEPAIVYALLGESIGPAATPSP